MESTKFSPVPYTGCFTCPPGTVCPAEFKPCAYEVPASGVWALVAVAVLIAVVAVFNRPKARP